MTRVGVFSRANWRSWPTSERVQLVPEFRVDLLMLSSLFRGDAEAPSTRKSEDLRFPLHAERSSRSLRPASAPAGPRCQRRAHARRWCLNLLLFSVQVNQSCLLMVFITAFHTICGMIWRRKAIHARFSNSIPHQGKQTTFRTTRRFQVRPRYFDYRSEPL